MPTGWEASALVPTGSEVLLVVNAGPKMGTIPAGLKGMKVEDAQKLLTAAGLTGRAVDAEDEPMDAVAGTVTKVTPDEGASIPTTQVVTLTVATGKSRLPSMVGMTREQAVAEAARYGFTNLTFEPSDGTTVLRSDPQALTLVDRTARITVYLESPTPSPTPTPAPTSPPSAPATTPRP